MCYTRRKSRNLNIYGYYIIMIFKKTHVMVDIINTVLQIHLQESKVGYPVQCAGEKYMYRTRAFQSADYHNI